MLQMEKLQRTRVREANDEKHFPARELRCPPPPRPSVRVHPGTRTGTRRPTPAPQPSPPAPSTRHPAHQPAVAAAAAANMNKILYHLFHHRKINNSSLYLSIAIISRSMYMPRPTVHTENIPMARPRTSYCTTPQLQDEDQSLLRNSRRCSTSRLANLRGLSSKHLLHGMNGWTIP